MNAITGQIRKGPSMNFRELKDRLLDLEGIAKRCRRRTNEKPDSALLASVLSNLLDEASKETYTNA